MDAQGDVVGLGNLAGGVGDLVLWLLVLEGEDASVAKGGLATFAPLRASLYFLTTSEAQSRAGKMTNGLTCSGPDSCHPRCGRAS